MPGERVLVAGEVRHGQEHARARHRGPVAVGRRRDRGQEGREDVPAAAAALRADRHLRRATTYPEAAEERELDEVAQGASKKVGLGSSSTG